MIDNNYIDNLPENPLDALLKISQDFLELSGEATLRDGSIDIDYCKKIIDFVAISKALIMSIDPNEHLLFDYPNHEDGAITFMLHADNYFKEVRRYAVDTTLERDILKKEIEFQDILSNTHSINLSDNELGRVQELINEMRELLNKVTYISKDHKRRLFKSPTENYLSDIRGL